MKKTPWFPGDVKPVRVGWYQREYTGTGDVIDTPDWFDGEKWYLGMRGGKSTLPAFTQGRRWRGLTKEPK